MLCKLLSASTRADSGAEVISLTDVGPVGERIRRQGITVSALGMGRGRPGVSGLVRLARHLRRTAPDLVQTWMYHADLVGGLAARLARNIPVVWGIRNGVLEPIGNKRSTIWTAKACARLSGRLPRRIIVNSERARRFHETMGYCAARMTVIPNGFDLTAFKPDPAVRPALRAELGLAPDAPLIGLVARFDPP